MLTKVLSGETAPITIVANGGNFVLPLSPELTA